MKRAPSTVDPSRDQLVQLLERAKARSGLSLREIARRAGTSHATLIAYLKGRKMPAFATVMRILEACGLAGDVELSPRIRSRNGLDRGEELEAVLNLAAAFPARPRKALAFPKFGRSTNKAA
ncbi:MAG: helix-turn-helix transcriptional regulator [Gammaproteobacteria bacterium]|nr:helix-turn-helix transcriptional regulator [Gammaproteobacteria bacterium]